MGRQTNRDIYAKFILQNLGVITQNQMALAVGVTHATISSWLKYLGVSDQRRKIVPEKQDCYFRENATIKTQAQMAVDLGVDQATVSRHLKRLNLTAKSVPRGRKRRNQGDH